MFNFITDLLSIVLRHWVNFIWIYLKYNKIPEPPSTIRRKLPRVYALDEDNDMDDIDFDE